MPSTMISPPREKREEVVQGKRRKNSINRKNRLHVEGTGAGGWYGFEVVLVVNNCLRAFYFSNGELGYHRSKLRIGRCSGLIPGWGVSLEGPLEANNSTEIPPARSNRMPDLPIPLPNCLVSGALIRAAHTPSSRGICVDTANRGQCWCYGVIP